MSLDHDRFMGICLELARKAGAAGNRPIGSVIVDASGGIVAQGKNRVYTTFDPTAHGETVAIREATMTLKTVDLSGCTIYTSLEPCPMCCWAIIDSRIGTLVMGGRYAGLGRMDMGRYSVESFLELTGRPLQVVTGIRARECEDLRRSWEAEQRPRGR